MWGTASAAFQIEGGASEDGRGPSMWDHLAEHNPEKIYDVASPSVAADFYHRYREDITMMKELGLKSFRFSISWSRLFPQGRGKLNAKGVEFYSHLIDTLLENDIEPFVDLYHWDIPQALMADGGFKNAQIIQDFGAYAKCCFERFGDRVMKWSTMNEPSVMAFVSYHTGGYPPFEKNLGSALLVAQNLLLMHYEAVRQYRKLALKGKIGAVIAFVPVYPRSFSEQDTKAAVRQQDFVSGWWLEPMFEGKYPDSVLECESVSGLMPPGYAEQLDGAFEAMDILGMNYYNPSVVGYKPGTLLGAEHVEGFYAQVGHFELYPPGLYDAAMYVKQRYNNPEIYVTENGISCEIEKSDAQVVDDPDRISFMREHLREVSRAIHAGADIRGYYYWANMDTFEATSGFRYKFGLIDIDRDSLKRSPRSSWYYYQNCIANNTVC